MQTEDFLYPNYLYKALLDTEGVTLDFDEGSIDALADLSAEINRTVENIGARRLATVLERLLEEISFTAPDRNGETIHINASGNQVVQADRHDT